MREDVLSISKAEPVHPPFWTCKPVEYVKVCPTYGPGFFYIPGTTTCLKVGGYAEFNYYGINRYTQSNGNGALSGVTTSPILPSRSDATNGHVTGRVTLDARDNTEYGIARAFVRIQWDRSSGSDDNSGSQPRRGQMFGQQSSGAYANLQTGFYGSEAYLQLGGLTVGRRTSFAWVGNPSLQFTTQNPSNGRANQAAYTASLGNGMSITAGLEDAAELREGVYGATFTTGSSAVSVATATSSSITNRSVMVQATTGTMATSWVAATAQTGTNPIVAGSLVWNSSPATQYYPQPNKMPDGVVSFDVAQSWGSIKVAGVYHRVGGFDTSTINGANGYAGMAGAKVNLPMIAAGDYLNIYGAYAEGAAARTIGNVATDTSAVQNASFGMGNAPWAGYDAVVVGGKLKLSTSYSFGGEFKHYFTPKVAAYVGASYGAIRYGAGKNFTATTAQDPHDADMWGAAVGVIWTPISNFEVNPEVAYRKSDVKSATGISNGYYTGVKSDDQWIGRMRVARTF